MHGKPPLTLAVRIQDLLGTHCTALLMISNVTDSHPYIPEQGMRVTSMAIAMQLKALVN
jgi:hypothetical protein